MMTGSNWKTTLLLASIVALWTLPWSGACLTAQDAQPEAPPAATKGERAKPRGRLPAYYARVVTASQRDQIYDIQTKFDGEIKQLQERLMELLSQRDSQVEALLTDEQRKQIATFVEEAKSRRTAGEKPAGEPSEASPTGESSTP